MSSSVYGFDEMSNNPTPLGSATHSAQVHMSLETYQTKHSRVQLCDDLKYIYIGLNTYGVDNLFWVTRICLFILMSFNIQISRVKNDHLPTKV
jgi:hypothetical protein